MPRSSGVAKSSTGLSTRMLLGLTGITQGESVFFNEIRPHLHLRSPRAYFAASDPVSCRSIVLLEDLAERGWSFPDPMTNAIGERDAADMVDELAAFHAACWNGGVAGAALDRLPSPPRMQERLNRFARFEKRVRTGLERAREHVPAALWARRDELWPAVMHALDLGDREPRTLLHQDVHLGNWLRDPDGRMGLYDW